MEALRTLFPESDFTLLAAILLLPALGALVNGLFGKRLGKEGVRLMALSALGGSFLASVLTYLLLPAEGKLSWNAWRWITVQGWHGQSIPIDVKFSVDALSGTMMLVITGVGFLIHLYSSEYMKEDPGYHRFFAYLNLFCFAMLVLVMGDNLAMLFVGWEGVGLCSYLLIGFWYGEDKNASAGRKAFVVNRIGDFGLLVAMALIVYYLGTVSFDGIQASANGLLQNLQVWPIGNLSVRTLPSWLHFLIPDQPITILAATAVGLTVFLGCAGKSAQIPLYIWLPDAMAGPTPVSALIHAATMVTAGVYLVARMSAVFVLSPAAMAVVAVTGAATALLAASIGLFQNDLKKVLAYSTVSQLGYMFMGVGVGAFAAGFFHVFTHAFFKACLFLGAGSVIHAIHVRIHDTDRSQDMKNMGGLKAYMPITRWTFLVSCLSIAGFPFLAGFWSKDEILWKAFSVDVLVASAPGIAPWTWPSWLGRAIYWAGVIGAMLTSFYMFRAYFRTFHGEFRGWKIDPLWKDPGHGHDDHGHDDHGHGHEEEHGEITGPVPHESPVAMTIPLIVLGLFAVGAGFFVAEPIHVAPLAHKLEPVFALSSRAIGVRAGAEGLMWPMMLPGVAAFLIGTMGAMVVYLNRRGEPERRFAASFPRLHALIYDKWRIDELYDATVVGMVDALADIFTIADKWIIDGILAKFTAALVGFLGTILRAFQTGRVQVYSAAMVLGLAGVGWFMVRPHATATVNEEALRRSGEVKLSAAPGFGYSYRWDVPETPEGAFAATPEQLVTLKPGETKEVTLRVRNAWGSESSKTFTLSRPTGGNRGPVDPAALPIPKVPTLPTGTIPAEQIPNLIQPKGLQ
ncbi:NADH-quinone oxidoreductase subunit L [Chondromyces crocatus]|uniref:NADH dehydrogenase (Ubiquinone) n=1 Tax=Chondromyces crocatus TaxID=52 RepID=A0A0K1EGA0_CHOCO|nr:NADH-quinone oxidoreductase subunit L [Chondromyces crocatus]AKT39900.1 NADH dehydrogenase (ubiquinone) [Chondromyces crocatus]